MSWSVGYDRTWDRGQIMKAQIPIYRAKKINSDEYIAGSYIHGEDKKHYISDGKFKIRASSGASLILTEIDPSTLAIHMPDMLASDSDRLLPNGEKDLRIFASLSEDGRGGDILDFEIYSRHDGWYKEIGILIYDVEDFSFKVHCEYESDIKLFDMNTMSNILITGIQ